MEHRERFVQPAGAPPAAAGIIASDSTREKQIQFGLNLLW
jgi:hypothetical protein